MTQIPPVLSYADYQLPRGVLWVNRIVWGAMLIGQVVAAVALAVVATSSRPRPTATNPSALLAANAILLGVGLVAVFAVRAWGFRGTGTDVAIAARYRIRLIIPMAALEGAGLLGIVAAFSAHHLMPTGLIAAVAVAVQVALFPRSAVTLD